jgi:hypothetical protein
MQYHALINTVVLAALAGQLACAPGAQQEPTQQQPPQQQEGQADQQQPVSPQEQQPGTAGTLVTDSTRYTVRFEGGMYRANIGFAYTNRSGDAVSLNYCRTPPPPMLEKRVAGEWVRAYSPIQLACLTLPPFRVAAGAIYRGVVDFAAAPRAGNLWPQLEVESIPGTYRLRWQLRTGNDPDAKDARTVEAISNEFRFVER